MTQIISTFRRKVSARLSSRIRSDSRQVASRSHLSSFTSWRQAASVHGSRRFIDHETPISRISQGSGSARHGPTRGFAASPTHIRAFSASPSDDEGEDNSTKKRVPDKERSEEYIYGSGREFEFSDSDSDSEGSDSSESEEDESSDSDSDSDSDSEVPQALKKPSHTLESMPESDYFIERLGLDKDAVGKYCEELGLEPELAEELHEFLQGEGARQYIFRGFDEQFSVPVDALKYYLILNEMEHIAMYALRQVLPRALFSKLKADYEARKKFVFPQEEEHPEEEDQEAGVALEAKEDAVKEEETKESKEEETKESVEPAPQEPPSIDVDTEGWDEVFLPFLGRQLVPDREHFTTEVWPSAIKNLHETRDERIIDAYTRFQALSCEPDSITNAEIVDMSNMAMDLLDAEHYTWSQVVKMLEHGRETHFSSDVTTQIKAMGIDMSMASEEDQEKYLDFLNMDPMRGSLPPLEDFLAHDEWAAAYEKEQLRKRAQEALDVHDSDEEFESEIGPDGRVRTKGGRKASTCNVELWPKESVGQSPIETINGKPLYEYFEDTSLRGRVLKPLRETDSVGLFNWKVEVRGGGLQGQADAIMLAMARALVKFAPETKPEMREWRLLTRNPRKVERKKPGRAKARRAFQWVKR